MTRLLSWLGDRNRCLALGLSVALALAYAFLNLHAAWDPAARLTNIRAGLVNEDQAVTVDGQAVAVGRDLTSTLLEAGTFGWRELARAEADRQIRAGSLDFYLYIPKDASRLVVGLPTAAKPEEAILTVYADPAYNYPMNSVADTLAATIREQLNGKIAATYLEALLGGMSGLGQAADGARQIADGTKAAGGGARELAGGLDQAKAGADQLYGGIGQVAEGAGNLHAGAVEIRDGNRELAAGLDKAEAGARAIAAGGRQLAGGARQLVDGYDQLADGNEQLADGIAEAAGGARQIKQGVQDSLGKPDPELAAASAAIGRAMKNLLVRRPYLLVDRDYLALKSNLEKLSARAGQLQSESVRQLAEALTQLENGLERAEDGGRRLTAGAREGYTKGEALVTGARQLSAGAAELAAGVDQSEDGARRLADGADRLAAGAAELASGSGRLQAGGQALAGGLGQLQAGGHKLSTGLGQLTGGTEQLAAGLGGAASGGPALPPRSNAAAMSQPVKVESSKVHPLPRPGEALMGLVIPIALWIGALALVLGSRIAGVAWGAGQTDWERLRSMRVPAAALALGVAAVSLLMGPKVAHPVLFVLFLGLAAAAFLAVNLALVEVLGHWGYLISSLLLILMPIAVGGRAPYILLPGVYRAVAPFLPLSHAIRGTQATISGGAWSIFWISVALLLAFLGLALWAQGRWGKRTEGA